ncbi:MAG: GPP34 family phosphoprotein [Chloroflexi bacterium]|nr:GPP34 family phosphoprotein [Chloroflexota bacterium]MYD49783.1 GPP34 family phosphoprotein [Chloroflexota bacterium]
MNCAVIGAALAELSLLHRIDTDLESLFLVDGTEIGDPILDPILAEIAEDPAQRSAQYWIERLAPRAESIIDSALERLVDLGVLEYHDGDFWTLTHAAQQGELHNDPSEGSTVQFVKTRISNFVFSREIPEPRDIIIICLINTCDVFRFMFRLDEDAEARIGFICSIIWT